MFQDFFGVRSFQDALFRFKIVGFSYVLRLQDFLNLRLLREQATISRRQIKPIPSTSRLYLKREYCLGSNACLIPSPMNTTSSKVQNSAARGNRTNHQEKIFDIP